MVNHATLSTFLELLQKVSGYYISYGHAGIYTFQDDIMNGGISNTILDMFFS